MSNKKQSLPYHSHFYEKRGLRTFSGDLSHSIHYFFVPGA